MKKRCAVAVIALALTLCLSGPALATEVTTQQQLINKENTLSASYAPADLVALNKYMEAGSGVTMERQAAEALGRLVKAAEEQGISGIYGTSGYRSYSTQTTLHNRKISYYRGLGYGSGSAAAAGRVVAPPGASEHQSGLAIDVTTANVGYGLEENFGQTKAGQWMAAHAWEYGFILRYPADKVDITGYIYEPWHFRYVGAPHAEYMYKNKLCLEEYYQLIMDEKVLGYTVGDGQVYAVYYNPWNNAADLPGQVLSVSQARAGNGGYLITTLAPDVLLYDLVGHWSEPEIRSLVEKGVVQGYPSNTYRPNRNISRAELVSLVARVTDLVQPSRLPEPELVVPEQVSAGPAGQEPTEVPAEQESPEVPAEQGPFVDAGSGDYYYPALMRLYQVGLIPDALLREADTRLYFDASRQVLRREAALTLAPLFSDLRRPPASPLVLSDLPEDDPQLQEAVRLLVDYGVIQGDASGRFNPEQKITRAEIGAMLMRIISYYEK